MKRAKIGNTAQTIARSQGPKGSRSKVIAKDILLIVLAMTNNEDSRQTILRMADRFPDETVPLGCPKPRERAALHRADCAARASCYKLARGQTLVDV
jgi:hypothetical protein